tara:strand:+ start:165 stop:362 length:198 start_codon:yes stop_codon:yes gene_type:complete
LTTPILENVWAGSSEDLNGELNLIIITRTRGGKGSAYSAVGSWESGQMTTWLRYVAEIIHLHTGK